MSLSFNDMKVALDVSIRAGHVPNIVGLQGIGKSDLVREFARERDYSFAEVTCSLIQEGDLAMPFISKNKEGEQGVSYAINKIITNLVKNSSDKEYGILFLDEFNRGSSQVQSELMNLVLQREIVGYRLAENIRVILAMNPSSEMSGYENTNYSVSYSDSAMLGRVISLDMKPSLTEWLEYGNKEDILGRTIIHPAVRDFLAINKDKFVTDEVVGVVNNTPRGWSRVSDILYTYEDMGVNNNSVLKNLISGTIEKASADSFLLYYKNKKKTRDYHSLAKRTLSASSISEWSSELFNMNDAELDKLFSYMVSLVGDGKISEVQKGNLTTLIYSVQKELAYSWVSKIEKEYPDLYDVLLEDNSFSSFVLGILVNANITEVGGFVGKQ